MFTINLSNNDAIVEVSEEDHLAIVLSGPFLKVHYVRSWRSRDVLLHKRFNVIHSKPA